MDVVVDVGGIYDPDKGRFDHHQPTFHDTFSSEHKTLLSSAGLVYKHFGKDIITKELVHPTEGTVNLLHRKIYDSFVEPFDAHDNGISAYPSDIQPRFHRSWDIFSQVNVLNPDWNEHGVDIQARFLQAVQLLRHNFEAILRRYIKSWLPARTILEKSLLAVSTGEEEMVDGRIIVLDEFCPWTDHLFDLEAEKAIKSRFLYAIYQDSTKSSWRIHAVPKSPDSFECRLALPEGWRGLRDADLDKVTGLNDCVFVHRGGFIGAHATKKGAIEMAKLSMKLQLDN